MDDMKISGTSNPYLYQNYSSVEANDKNTLTMVDYFKLLAAQLQNQDVTNPMDNSQMMAQMVQMGMMQAITAMTDSMEASTAVTTQTYAASLIGQEVTVMVTEETKYEDVEVPVGVKYAKVEYVSFVNGTPKFKLEGDSKEYTMSYLVGVGRIPDPFAKPDEEGDGSDTDKVEGEGETDGVGDPPPEEGDKPTDGTDGVTDGTQEGAGTEQTPVIPEESPETPKVPESTDGAQEGAAAAAGITESEQA